MSYVDKLTSTKTGTKLFWIIGLTVVLQVTAGVKTSSPGFNLSFFFA